jgi:dihydroflavonol-4-reductase
VADVIASRGGCGVARICRACRRGGIALETRLHAKLVEEKRRMGARVGVAGANRFLSAHIVDQLVQSGFEPVVVPFGPQPDRDAPVTLNGERAGATSAGAAAQRTALDGCTYLHYLGSAPSASTGVAAVGRARRADRAPVQAVLDVLLAARDVGIRRVIVSGSCRTRQSAADAPVDEDGPFIRVSSARDPFVRHKILEEKAVALYAHAADIEAVAILAGETAGPQDTEPSYLGSSLVSRLNGVPDSAAGVGRLLPVVDVRDVARAHVAAMEVGTPSSRYLVVGQTVTAHEWAESFSRVTGLPIDDRPVRASAAKPAALLMGAISHVTGARAWMGRNGAHETRRGASYDCGRARRELELQFTPLETTVRDAVEWYALNGWVTDEARLAIVNSALDRAAYDAAVTLSPQSANPVAAG